MRRRIRPLVYPEITETDPVKNRIANTARRLAAPALGAMLAGMPSAAMACDACMGGKDPTLRPAVNGAIFFMLGLVACMLTGAGFFIRYLARRANSPAPAHAEFMNIASEKPNHA